MFCCDRKVNEYVVAAYRLIELNSKQLVLSWFKKGHETSLKQTKVPQNGSGNVISRTYLYSIMYRYDYKLQQSENRLPCVPGPSWLGLCTLCKRAHYNFNNSTKKTPWFGFVWNINNSIINNIRKLVLWSMRTTKLLWDYSLCCYIRPRYGPDRIWRHQSNICRTRKMASLSVCVYVCLCHRNQTGNAACCVFFFMYAHTVWPTRLRLSYQQRGYSIGFI